MIDIQEAERFLAALDPAASSFTFQTFDEDKLRQDKTLARVFNGTLAEHLDRLKFLNSEEKRAGVFVTINETDLRGRKEYNIIRTRAVFVDLDGSPIEPVLAYEHQPQIIIESSPGRWHAYWLVNNMPLDRFKSVQKGLIKTFKSDKAVNDLSRVMRLPGFIHRKGEPYVTRVDKITERPPYSANDFAALSGSETFCESRTVSKNSSGSARSRWGQLNALALEKLSAWVPDLFANAAVLKSGVYRVSSVALGRELQEDLSISPAGIKDFGVHDTGDEREGKRTPIDLVMEYGKKDFAEAAEWLRGKVGEADGVTVADFRAYMPQHVYIFLPTGEPWPAGSVNARLRPILLYDADGNPMLEEAGGGKPGKQKSMPASVWLDHNQPVEQMTWAPGEQPLIQDRLIADGGWTPRPGVTCLNLYRPPTIKHGNAAGAQRWIDHVHKVYPDDAVHIIRYFAQRVQQPGVKINHALVLGGEPGIGKDTLLEPVKHAVGHWNFQEISPQNLLGRFNGFLKSVILRISEARDLGDVNRFQFYEHMKNYAAAPPDVLRCDEKHLREYAVQNVCGVIITTNYKTDGIFLPANDRRHYVAWSDLKKDEIPEGYWKQLWGWYEAGGSANVAAYLSGLDLSSFDPKAPPPKTAAFWGIVDANRAPEDAELADVIDHLGNPPAVTLEDLSGAAYGSFQEWLLDRKSKRAIPHRLEQVGYVPVRNNDAQGGLWVVSGRRQVVYARTDLSTQERLRAVKERQSRRAPMVRFDIPL